MVAGQSGDQFLVRYGVSGILGLDHAPDPLLNRYGGKGSVFPPYVIDEENSPLSGMPFPPN